MTIDIDELEREIEKIRKNEISTSNGFRDSIDSNKIFGNKRFGGFENPITVRGFNCLYSYLNRLRTCEGSMFSYCRLRSKYSEATESILDYYKINSLDGNVITHVYIDTFHPLESVCAPFGLSLKPISEVSENEMATLYKPVRLSVLNFTDDEI